MNNNKGVGMNIKPVSRVLLVPFDEKHLEGEYGSMPPGAYLSNSGWMVCSVTRPTIKGAIPDYVGQVPEAIVLAWDGKVCKAGCLWVEAHAPFDDVGSFVHDLLGKGAMGSLGTLEWGLNGLTNLKFGEVLLFDEDGAKINVDCPTCTATIFGRHKLSCASQGALLRLPVTITDGVIRVSEPYQKKTS